MKMKKVSRSRWAMLAFVLACVIVLINLPASAEQIWTDFSPKPVGVQDATTEVVVAQEVFGRGIDI